MEPIRGGRNIENLILNSWKPSIVTRIVLEVVFWEIGMLKIVYSKFLFNARHVSFNNPLSADV